MPKNVVLLTIPGLREKDLENMPKLQKLVGGMMMRKPRRSLARSTSTENLGTTRLNFTSTEQPDRHRWMQHSSGAPTVHPSSPRNKEESY
ncbi:MAG: hypothetical protein VX438_18825 [Planctomycetota bacterium]|nr:hypothetical protein [Planctomycetota bacterium]